MSEKPTESPPSRVSEYERLVAANTWVAGVLEEHAAQPTAWAARLERGLRELAAAFAYHRDVAEAPDGNLARIAEAKPALLTKISRQRTEHIDLLASINRLADEVAELRSFEDIPVDRLRLQAGIIHDSMRLHIAVGADLLYEAYFQEEGGEG